MSRYIYGGNPYGNYGGLASRWGFGDKDKDKDEKEGKKKAKKAKGPAPAYPGPGRMLPPGLRIPGLDLPFLPKASASAKMMPQTMETEDFDFAPKGRPFLPEAAALDIAPAAATTGVPEIVQLPPQVATVEPVMLEAPKAVPAVMMPGMVMPQPMGLPQRPTTATGMPQPIVPPRITPQQARLGAMTAALASALLLF